MWWNKKKNDKMVALLHDNPINDTSPDIVTTWIINEIDRIHTSLYVNEKKTVPFQYPPREWETKVRFNAMQRLLRQLKEQGIKHHFKGIDRDFYSK